MSEEAAFLEALKANPADDTVRLVYADWLDEHAEPAKAEYLRLVATLAQATESRWRKNDVARLTTLAELFSTAWRWDSGSRFALVLRSCPDSRLLPVTASPLRAIMNATGMGPSSASAVIVNLPSRLIDCAPFDRVRAVRDHLLLWVPTIGLEIVPSQ